MWREGDCERIRTPRSVQVTVCSAFIYMTTFFLKFRCRVSQLSSCFPSPHPLSSQVPVSLKKGSSWLLSDVNCFASHPGTAPWAFSSILSLQQSQRPQPCYIPLPPDWGRGHIWLNRGWERKLATTTCIPVDQLELEGLQRQRVKPAFPDARILVNEPMNHGF